MKLIVCEDCHDIVLLVEMCTRHCECEASWGHYIDSLNATYGGKAIPIVIINSSLANVIQHQPEEGLGARIDAFSVPKKCDTFKRETEK